MTAEAFLVGTAQVRLCPPYALALWIIPAVMRM
jgi:hypothetical protein